MVRNLNRRRLLGSYALAVGLGIVGSTLTSQAMAGCAKIDSPSAPPASWHTSAARSWKTMPTVYSSSDAARMIRVGDESSDHDRFPGGPQNAAIVGLWKFTMTSDAGVVLDFGTVIWHGDGTEFTISGSRPPSSGDVCMGAWKQTGPHTYKLNHLALAWESSDSPPATPRVAAFAGFGVEAQEVTLSGSGNSFQGSFTIDAYDPTGTTVQAHAAGRVTATRIGPDTKLP